MITDIAYLEMLVKDFDECLHVYTKELGMTEIQNTQSVQNEKGEWISTASAEQGNREAIIQVGNSYLVLHEDANAITQVLPNGDIISANEVEGTVGHYSFYAQGNDHAYSHMKSFYTSYRYGRTKEGPSVQPMNHSYLQRSLLEFADPNGYTVQISEIIDPRLEKQKRRREKTEIANMSQGAIVKGFDHFSMRCSDLKIGKGFYSETLGLEIIHHEQSDTSEEYVFSAGLCDLELSSSSLNSLDKPLYGPRIVSSYGLWCDDLESVINNLSFEPNRLERDLALGVRVKYITLNSGDGFLIQILEQIQSDS